eukprot:COSAG05_NODE_12590_length_462_cov_0.950413_2_plen_61_part_01
MASDLQDLRRWSEAGAMTRLWSRRCPRLACSYSRQALDQNEQSYRGKTVQWNSIDLGDKNR